MRKKTVQGILPETTIVTVVAQKGKRIFVKDMTYGDALESKATNRKFHYTFYQQGFCSIKSS